MHTSTSSLAPPVAIAVELEGNLDVPITHEIEVKAQRRKRKATNVAKKQTKKRTKPTKANKQRGTTGKPKS